MTPAEQQVRIVIYARVSVDRGGKSVDGQIKECRAHADSEGWPVVDVIVDKGSASRHARKDREHWPKVEKLLESQQATMLMTWEFSRATRELEFYVVLRNACIANRSLWWYGGTIYDMSKREDRFRTGLDALLAEDEADRTSERTGRGTRDAATMGRPAMGPASFGYRRVYDPNTGKLLTQEPHPEVAPIVQDAAEKILAGRALSEVCRYLNDKGVLSPKGRPWDVVKLRAMILRPGLAALRVHRGEVVGDASWEPILTEEQHRDLLEKLTDPARRTQRDGAVKHLLTGIALCGVCEKPVRRLVLKGYAKYQCRGSACVLRKQDLVDDIVTRTITKRLSREDARALFLPDHSDELARIRGELATAKARLEECYRLAESDDEDDQLSPLGLARMERKLQPQIDSLRERMRSAHRSPNVARLIDGGPREVWETLSISERREVVRTLVTVHIDRSRKGNQPDPESVRVEWR